KCGLTTLTRLIDTKRTIDSSPGFIVPLRHGSDSILTPVFPGAVAWATTNCLLWRGLRFGMSSERPLSMLGTITNTASSLIAKSGRRICFLHGSAAYFDMTTALKWSLALLAPYGSAGVPPETHSGRAVNTGHSQFAPRSSRPWQGVLAAIAGLALLTACSAPQHPSSPMDSSKPVVWPAPPEPARIAFVQSVHRPADIGVKMSSFSRLGHWLTGSEKGNEPLIKPFGIA